MNQSSPTRQPKVLVFEAPPAPKKVPHQFFVPRPPPKNLVWHLFSAQLPTASTRYLHVDNLGTDLFRQQSVGLPDNWAVREAMRDGTRNRRRSRSSYQLPASWIR